MTTLYIETSIVSYLRQRPSSQVVMAARQLLTNRWWDEERGNYELVASQYIPRKKWWMMIQKKSNSDTTIEEIHRNRQRMADKFGGDIAAILEDARKRQAASGRPVWQGPSSNKRLQLTGDHGQGQ